MHLGTQHRERRNGTRARYDAGIIRAIDALTYLASFISLSFTSHQVWIIWSTQDASGVSIVSWIGYTIASCIWALYGYAHRVYVIFFTHAGWIIFSILIIMGVAMFN
jgi:uncharacterized protein with PQ loop repeat